MAGRILLRGAVATETRVRTHQDGQLSAVIRPHPRRRGNVGEVAVVHVAEGRDPSLLPNTDRAGRGTREENQVPFKASSCVWAVWVAGSEVGEYEAVQGIGAHDCGLRVCQLLVTPR